MTALRLCGLATNLHRLGVSDKVIQQILRHANVTTTINIYVKMVRQDAEDAMRKLESRCSLVVPKTVPKLTDCAPLMRQFSMGTLAVVRFFSMSPKEAWDLGKGRRRPLPKKFLRASSSCSEKH